MPSYLSPGVYVEEVSSGSKPIEGVGTAVAAFVGFAAKGPLDEPVLVTNWTQFTQNFGQFTEGAYLPHAVYAYFANGGGAAYIVRVGGSANGTQDTAAAGTELPSEGAGRPLVVRALEAGHAVSVEVQEATESADETFKLVVRAGGDEEVYDNVSTRRGASNVAAALRKSKLVTVEEVKGAALATPSKNTRTVVEATSSGALSADDYIGDPDERTGFGGLEAIDDVTMLCVPDLMTAYESGRLDMDGVKAVQLAMIAHCELMADRVAILDPPPGLRPQQVAQWRLEVAGYDSKYATLYWPWVKVGDPRTGKPVLLPPSGHVAGVWARNDDTRGVHKAPANEVLRGVVELQSGLTRGEHDRLNPIGVNCLRFFPGQGIRVWGARTLSSDAEWRYLNVRRLFNYIEKSVLTGTSWVVFEPNDHFLWHSVERIISMFLRRIWRSGALFGQTPEEAFYVKCDEENNPPENRDAGILTVDIGVAPVKPAEFVVFRLSQYSEGAELKE
ncbi:phage tail sheath subtilisin-like domain-containing protein [Amycolatopsis sp. OK19-0408]|uniref:Phage tail sheath subtilisin-like domain-containing protein n=1 Tax=Amycolatopsis iheyensis TaxID=2945988 RepID=A0A9X2NJU3_9PSEU|nr:phage tail sheath subtilisin-like domain-containing protein [Amycolatopsis iheyensis]MCR6487819.1 phage tail sheath subtilisin-like domain-containing protein [Amycolatopsis iheyensis]